MPHTLYACLGSGNCFKPWLLMNQLNIPFETQLVDVLQGAQKAPEFLSINPLGVVPYLVTDTEAGIGESNAMLWFLAEGSHLMPTTAEDRAEALQWMFFEQSKLEPFISPARFFTTILPQMRAERAVDIAQWQDKARLGLAQLDRHLVNRQFMLASGYSITDISIFGYVHVLQEAGLEIVEYPAVADWIARVEATPGYQPLSKLGSDAQSAAA